MKCWVCIQKGLSGLFVLVTTIGLAACGDGSERRPNDAEMNLRFCTDDN